MVMTTPETATQETLSPAELGRKSHEAMTGLIGDLLVTPEFNTALGQAFFGRSFANGGRNPIEAGVYFEKDGSGYFVSWEATPLRYGPEEVRDYDAALRLNIDKYDPSKKHERSQGKTAQLSLLSRFVEDQDGNIKEFTGGTIAIEEEIQYTEGSLIPRHTQTTFNEEAYEKISALFGNLRTPVIL